MQFGVDGWRRDVHTHTWVRMSTVRCNDLNINVPTKWTSKVCTLHRCIGRRRWNHFGLGKTIRRFSRQSYEIKFELFACYNSHSSIHKMQTALKTHWHTTPIITTGRNENTRNTFNYQLSNNYLGEEMCCFFLVRSTKWERMHSIVDDGQQQNNQHIWPEDTQPRSVEKKKSMVNKWHSAVCPRIRIHKLHILFTRETSKSQLILAATFPISVNALAKFAKLNFNMLHFNSLNNII